MGLEDGDDARRPGLRRGDGRANLLAVVRVVVHDVDVARRRADQLETARDAREACEQAHHGVGVETDLERDHRGGGGVLEVVEPGLWEVQGQITAAVSQDAPGASGQSAPTSSRAQLRANAVNWGRSALSSSWSRLTLWMTPMAGW